jgi:hypothetical protein
MKIIEGLKQIKDLQRKAEDLRKKVAQHSAHTSFETPVYGDQKEQVRQWIQSHADILKEISRIQTSIQRTNLQTNVTIELGGKQVTKSIAEWIHRRRDLAKYEMLMWQSLTDRGIKEQRGIDSMGQPIEIKTIRCFDPKERDEKVSELSSEPSFIDGKLEIVNAVTDLI